MCLFSRILNNNGQTAAQLANACSYTDLANYLLQVEGKQGRTKVLFSLLDSRYSQVRTTHCGECNTPPPASMDRIHQFIERNMNGQEGSDHKKKTPYHSVHGEWMFFWSHCSGEAFVTQHPLFCVAVAQIWRRLK